MKTHYMIDIETTGVNKETDDVLEIGIVPIELNDEGYWEVELELARHELRQLHLILHNKRQPENLFAKEHMSELYKKCNDKPEGMNYMWAKDQIRDFIHGNTRDDNEPKFFMGWNASNFDCEFLIKKGILDGSRYVEVDGKDTIQGDIHYRIYEQTGALNLLLNSTGFSKKTLFALGNDLIPEDVKLDLPKGKKHDALYDCYSQINMMNGMIALYKRGWKL